MTVHKARDVRCLRVHTFDKLEGEALLRNAAPSSPPDWDWVGSVKGRSGDERSPQAEKLSVASFDTQTIFHKDGSNSWSKAER